MSREEPRAIDGEVLIVTPVPGTKQRAEIDRIALGFSVRLPICATVVVLDPTTLRHPAV